MHNAARRKNETGVVGGDEVVAGVVHDPQIGFDRLGPAFLLFEVGGLGESLHAALRHAGQSRQFGRRCGEGRQADSDGDCPISRCAARHQHNPSRLRKTELYWRRVGGVSPWLDFEPEAPAREKSPIPRWRFGLKITVAHDCGRPPCCKSQPTANTPMPAPRIASIVPSLITSRWTMLPAIPAGAISKPS